MMDFKNFKKYEDGVYISVNLSPSSTVELNAYMQENLSTFKINKSLHCTLIYSQKPLKNEVQIEEYDAFGTFKGFSLFGPDKNILVLELDCDTLVERNKELVQKYNFISDFDEYKPHVTLAYEITKDFNLDVLPEIGFEVQFCCETIEPLDKTWSSK